MSTPGLPGVTSAPAPRSSVALVQALRAQLPERWQDAPPRMLKGRQTMSQQTAIDEKGQKTIA
ncbi:MAG: hypothetical protein WKF80_05235, partial [Thermomicrobiales bacterium]